ncbi:unnamed protein product [Callosobruchus maculatus]|uniref:Magnesium-dependent phosphatase 1 n=1 Tax=Callosobruchus maculatus TaxID=64391 RepID=A0A653C261_CALMS|nr:unnamed protein product [Callosobruchus maculatus]
MSASTKQLKLIVFDLDYTLWPYWADTHIKGPFERSSNGHIVDSLGSKVQCYPEVPETLKYLHEKGYPFAVASRCTDNKGCRTLLNLFGWDQYFKYLEIYPGRKFKHFNRIKEASGVDYSEMIFFDDEHRNIDDMTSIGVHSVFVPEGLTKKLVQDSIDKFYQNK